MNQATWVQVQSGSETSCSQTAFLCGTAPLSTLTLELVIFRGETFWSGCKVQLWVRLLAPLGKAGFD